MPARPSGRAPVRPVPRGGPRRWRRRPRAPRRRTARRARRGPRADSRRVGLDLDEGAELVQVAVVAGQPCRRGRRTGLRSRRTPSSALDGRTSRTLASARGRVQVHRRAAIGQPCRSLKNTSEMQGMGHPFRIREIAIQAGLSGGDRRPRSPRPQWGSGQFRRRGPPGHGGPATGSAQVRLAGRTFVVDLVVRGPPPGSRRGVRAALEAELPRLRPAVIRVADSTSREAAAGGRDGRARWTGSPRAGPREWCSRRPTTGAWSRPWGGSRGRYPGRHPGHRPADQPAHRPTSASTTGPPGRPPRTWSTSGSARARAACWSRCSRGLFRGEEEREMGFRATLRALRGRW